MLWHNTYERERYLTQLASDLSTLQQVRRVELFGSSARGHAQINSDFDLIVIVDEEVFEQWIKMVTLDNVDQNFYGSLKSDRLRVAAFLLGAYWLEQGWPQVLDVFLFPANWQERLGEIQDRGRHSDTDFMANVARDAVRFDPELCTFPIADMRKAEHHDERFFTHAYAQQMLD